MKLKGQKMIKGNKKICTYFVLLVIFNAVTGSIFSQPFTPGVSVFDATEYVEYIPGNLPIVISVPHGGYLEPSDIPDRDCDNFVCVRDAYTQELGRSLSEAFFEQTGCYPHLIINLLHRKKFDANREINEAADGNPTVEQSWQGYHAFLDSAKAQIEEDYGRGLFLDLHGHGHTVQRIELGYRITKNELQLADNELDASFYVEMSSIQTLVADNLGSLSHAELLRGEHSFGTLLETKAVPAVPSMSDPFPIGDESYFSGGYNTGRHGSVDGGNIDGIQIECHQDIRFDAVVRDRFADSLATVINAFVNIHYNNEYANSYCNLISGISKSNSNPYNINIFPNPASANIYIESEIKEIEISIYNSLGQKLYAELWLGNPIEVSFLKTGYYILEMRKGDLILATRNFIKY